MSLALAFSIHNKQQYHERISTDLDCVKTDEPTHSLLGVTQQSPTRRRPNLAWEPPHFLTISFLFCAVKHCEHHEPMFGTFFRIVRRMEGGTGGNVNVGL
jgi:hypothetical protein